MKRRIKHWLGLFYARTGLYRRRLRDRAVVVLFHRVDERLGGDPISCTPGEFRTWCRFLGRHFHVVDLSTLVEKLERGEDIGLHAAITFDDGYRDNFEQAAPELERLGLPACFFVATDFIGSNHLPWWDEQLPFRPEWMSWDEVRELTRRGFEIGSHGMTHADLARVDAAAAEHEIQGSRERLEQELGARVRHFSYPYGGRESFSEAARQTVRQAGYDSCLSAHGGLVAEESDPFHVERVPISPWFLSPYQFLAEVIADARAERRHEP